MPANLTPDYHRAEQRLREARSPDEKIDALEEMLRVMPKHKGTDHLQADIRARIAKLRKEPGRKGARGFTYIVPREGAGQVAIVGPPNSGKSSLVAALTHARPEVGDYPFTTREPTPGMMPFEDIAFQLVDLPPISEQHAEPWVFDLVRHADLVWVVLNAVDALEGFDEVVQLLQTHHITLSPVTRGRAHVVDAGGQCRDALLVLSGIDRPGAADSVAVVDELLEHRWQILSVSAVTGAGFDVLKQRTFEAFDIIRVRTKQPGKPPDMGAPFTLPRGSTVGALAERIHKDLISTMKFARVWGRSAFDGQAVQRDHVLAEGDIVEIHG